VLATLSRASGSVIQSVPYIVSVNGATLSHRKLEFGYAFRAAAVSRETATVELERAAVRRRHALLRFTSRVRLYTLLY